MARSDVISSPTKLLLLYLGHRMNDHGHVDVISRKALAEIFDVHQQRIAERIAEARRAELIDLVPGSGVRGTKARYVAILADMRTAERYPLRTAEAERIPTPSGTHSTGQFGQRVPDSGTHNARASSSASHAGDDNERDPRADHITEGRSDEEPAARSPVAAFSRFDSHARAAR